MKANLAAPMKRAALTPLFIVALAVSSTPTSFAHHSISSEFNGSQRIELAGTVTKVAWANPHAFFYVDVKDARTGSVANWSCELGSPNMLFTLGWTATTLKVGMSVTFTGIRARDGSHKVIARNIVADGTRLVAWPSEHTTP